MGHALRVVLSSLCMFAATAAADEVPVSAEKREALDATIYSNGLALIRDRRAVDLAAGASRLALADVSPRMVPSSLRIAADDLTVAAVDYDFDVMSGEALLRRAVGEEVGVVRTHPTTGEDRVERATVLSIANGVVLRYRDRIETGVPGRLVFDSVPDDLRAEPALVASVFAGAAGARPLELSYLAEGLTWRADYVLIVDAAAGTLAMEGRAMITNQSGLDLVDAEMALVAGEVRRVSETPEPRGRPEAMMARAAMADAAPAPEPVREAFSALHLYRVGGPLTLGDRQTRQIALLSAKAVTYEHQYVSLENAAAYYLRTVSDEPRLSHPDVRFRFLNNQDSGIGEPLPAGIVRVFGEDQQGTLRLIGEARTGHVPVGGAFEVVPASAFDITVRREQLELTRAGLGEDVRESTHRITVRNGRDAAVVVRVIEMIPGDWQILEESQEHSKPLADRAEWAVEVPAGGETVVEYRVRVQT